MVLCIREPLAASTTPTPSKSSTIKLPFRVQDGSSSLRFIRSFLHSFSDKMVGNFSNMAF